MIKAEYLRDILDYDPSTGIFKWKVTKSSKAPIGGIAGSIHSGEYTRICIDGKMYQAHRLAWLYVYDEWPKDQLDHINRTKTDNRICNLREATDQQNKFNVSVHKNNKLGVKGVHQRGDRYIAWIKCNGKGKHIGVFDTVGEASDAYNKELKRLIGLL